MNRGLVSIGAVILAAACGCATVSKDEYYLAVQRDLEKRYQVCVDANMTKADLVIQVGSPTAKEITTEGEIWVYVITLRGPTVTQGERGVFGTWTETASTPEEKYVATVVFDGRGVAKEFHHRGKVGPMAGPNNPFLTLECRPRPGGPARGEQGGIGIRISTEDGNRAGVTVLEVMEGTPAQKAGILPGDEVIQVDDLPTKGMTAEEFTGIVRGRPGTRVTLLVRRAGLEAPREFTMTRASLPAR